MAKTIKPAESKRKAEKTTLKKQTKKEGQQKITECFPVEKRKVDRFNGLSEEELLNRTLPDHLAENLDILIVGINPGLFAAYKGHHYAGPGNHFWKCLYLSGIIPHPMTANDDYKLIEYGIGFTNMVQRTTRGSADLKPKEIKEGSIILLEKIRTYKPKIAVFNGKEIFRIFSGQKDFNFGKQPSPVDGTVLYVMPSSSARCTQLPRAMDKVPFYVALRKLRDHLRGELPYLTENEITFSSVLVTASRKNGAKVEAVVGSSVSTMKSELIDNDNDPCDGLDEDGRPLLLGRQSFDMNIIKKECNDDVGIDDNNEFADAASAAHDGSSQILHDGRLKYVATETSATAIMEGFTDFLIPTGSAPAVSYSSGRPVNYSVDTVGIITCPATTSGQDGDETGEQNGSHLDGDGDNGEHEESHETEPNGSVPSHNHHDSLEHQQQGSQLGEQHLGNFPPTYGQQMASSIPHHANGDELLAATSEHSVTECLGPATPTTPQQPASIISQAPSSGHRPSLSNLAPEILQHVEEAIELVLQRARAGPLQMPTFRNADKLAAAQAAQQQSQQRQQHHQQQQLSQQSQQHHQPHHQHHHHQQQQQHQNQQQQQQMLANLQLQAAAVAAAQAAHFDLTGRMKSSDPGLANYSTSGGGTGLDHSNANAAGLYQYFQQQQQQPQSNQGFSGNAFPGSSSGGANYGNWQTASGFNAGGPATTNPNQGGGQNLYNQAMTAQYFQNAAAFGSYGGAAPVLGNFGTASPYFVQPQQQQQQQQQPSTQSAAQSSMYGQYAGGFFAGVPQQQQQQQSPHNL